VETAVQSNKFMFAGVQASQFERAFNSLSAAVPKKRLGETTRSNVGQLFGKVSDWLHVIEIRRGVDQLFHLLFGSADHFRIAMAGVDDGNSREAVKVLSSVDIRDGATRGAVDDDGRDRLEEAGHDVVFVFLEGVGHR
jgi:hypothetical protein